MEKLKGRLTIELTIEDANYINELIERDKAKAVKEYPYSNSPSLAICPRCDRVINTGFCFCGDCGQRLDTENYAL